MNSIVTATPILKQPAPFIEPEFIQTGTLCVSLDFDAAFKPSCLERAEMFLTDDLAQYSHYKQKGHFGEWPDPVADLGAIVDPRSDRTLLGSEYLPVRDLTYLLDVRLNPRTPSGAPAPHSLASTVHGCTR